MRSLLREVQGRIMKVDLRTKQAHVICQHCGGAHALRAAGKRSPAPIYECGNVIRWLSVDDMVRVGPCDTVDVPEDGWEI